MKKHEISKSIGGATQAAVRDLITVGMSLIAVLLIIWSTPSRADVGIASGQPTGTNFPMAEDIVRVCSTPKNPIHNVLSDGSIDNIYKVYGDKNAQYGICQVDALVYQQGIDPKMMDRIVMIFPFFSTEMHLIVKEGSKIASLTDLQGKRVVEGPEASGTWVSVQVIKATTGITWQPQLLSQKDGYNAVLNGTADAEFIVAGAPVGLLTEAKGIKLVPLSHPKLDAFKYYTRTLLPTNKYPWQKTSVSTYKVDNALITYAYKNQYQQEISELVTCITRNMSTLRTTGHPKWKDVDPLDIDRIAWPAHPAAINAIKRETRQDSR